MDEEFAPITFMPVCTKCLNIIFQTVDAKIITEVESDLPMIIGASYEIIPNKCPYCGIRFDAIKIPTKLPYKATEYII